MEHQNNKVLIHSGNHTDIERVGHPPQLGLDPLLPYRPRIDIAP